MREVPPAFPPLSDPELCDFDVTRPPVALPVFLSRDDLVLVDVVGLLVEPSEIAFSAESFEVFSWLVSSEFELVLEGLDSSAVVRVVSVSVVWSVGTIGSSFAGEAFMSTSTSVSVTEAGAGNGSRSSLVCLTVSWPTL